jgi:hypothetical protein
MKSMVARPSTKSYTICLMQLAHSWQAQLVIPFVLCRSVSSPQRSSSTQTGSQSSEGFSTCNHRDAGGTAMSADTTPIRACTPASGCSAVRQAHEVDVQAPTLAPVTPPQASSLSWRTATTAGQAAPAVKVEAPAVKMEAPIAVDLVKHEPLFLRWLPDDSSLSRYAQVQR